MVFLLGFCAFRFARQSIFVVFDHFDRPIRSLWRKFPRFFHPRTPITCTVLRSRVFLAGNRPFRTDPRLFPAKSAAFWPSTAKKSPEKGSSEWNSHPVEWNSRPIEWNSLRFAETPIRKGSFLDRQFLGFPADSRPCHPAGICVWRGIRSPGSPMGDSRGLDGHHADPCDDRSIPAVL